MKIFSTRRRDLNEIMSREGCWPSSRNHHETMFLWYVWASRRHFPGKLGYLGRSQISTYFPVPRLSASHHACGYPRPSYPGPLLPWEFVRSIRTYPSLVSVEGHEIYRRQILLSITKMVPITWREISNFFFELDLEVYHLQSVEFPDDLLGLMVRSRYM